MKSKWLNAITHVGEWMLSVLFILAAISELTTPEPVFEGIVGQLVSDPIAVVLYAVWFSLMAGALAFSKIRKKKKLHKHVLMAMYLTTIYTIVLAAAVGAGLVTIIDDIIIGLIAAACWMRWKFRTEYIGPHQFDNDIWELRKEQR